MPKMESNKVELLKAVQNERGEASVYPDEVIFSNLYYVSFSHALRAIEGYIAAGRSDEFVRDCRDANEWITEKSSKVRDISVINCNGVQREHNKKLNNGLPILHKVPPKRDYGRYFCIMAEKGGTSHGGLTEKLSPFFHAKKQEVNAYGR